MDLQSAGVILRILNLVALADGGVSLEGHLEKSQDRLIATEFELY